MKIGLLGGSFNPPHQGHIHISLETRKYLKLDQIWWLPNKQNPLKSVKNSNFENRLQKCRHITQNYRQILVKNYEKKLNSNYSIDLIKKLINQHKKQLFFFIIGGDNLVNFHHWQQWQEITKLVPIVIFDRDHCFHQAVRSKAFLYAKKNGKKCIFIKRKKYNISSSLLNANSG